MRRLRRGARGGRRATRSSFAWRRRKRKTGASRVRVGILCSRVRVEEKLLVEAFGSRASESRRSMTASWCFDIAARSGAGRRSWSDRSRRRTALAALRVLVDWGVPTVNTLRGGGAVRRQAGDRVGTARRRRAEPRTLVAFSPESALRAPIDIGYPVVLKPAAGSWGRLLARINDRDAAEAIFEDSATLGSAGALDLLHPGVRRQARARHPQPSWSAARRSAPSTANPTTGSPTRPAARAPAIAR